MKKILSSAAALVFSLGIWGGVARATLAPAPSPCATGGTPFVTLTQNIANDPDSGVHGNWATDAFTEHVTVWLGSDNATYCANANTVNGTFVTAGGISPEAGTPLATGITGTFTGGENYTIPSSTALAAGYSTSTPTSTSLPDSNTAGFSWWVHTVFPSIATSSGSGYVNTYSLTYVTSNYGTWTDADAVSGGDKGDLGPAVNVSTSTPTGYSTIQAAVNAAAPGDTIDVASGTYNETVSITKPLTINGAQTNVPGANASGTQRLGNESVVNAMNISASNVIVNGFSFTNPGTQVSIVGSSGNILSGVQLKDDIFNGYASVGIPTEDAGNLLISGNYFTTNANGEPMQIKSDATAGGCNGTTLEDNVFRNAGNNGGADMNFSCTGSHSSGVTVTGNTDLGNTGGTSLAAFAGIADDLSITSNTASNISGSALYFWGGMTGSTVVANNKITNGGSSAVSIHDDLDGVNTGIFTITGNTFSGNAHGIYVASGAVPSGANVVAHGNDLSGNGTAGIEDAFVTTSTSLAVNATGNWWGASTGPADLVSGDGSIPDTNASGTGAAALGAVKYSGWCTNSVCDEIAPTVSVTPVAGSVLNGTTTFTITVTDNNPLDPTKNTNVWVYLYNNAPPQKSVSANVNLSSGTGTFTVDTTKLNNGSSTLDVGIVYDAAGNPSGRADNYFKNYDVENILSPNVITDAASPVATYSATLNGTNGPVNADNTSFWWGTTPLTGTLASGTDPGSSEFPVSGWTHDNGLGAISAGSSFNEPVTGLAPGTKYYFVAWVHVGGVWYPGNVLTFITPSGPTVSVITNSAEGVIPTGATLNGTNGPVNADNTSFWWGTTPLTGTLASGTDPGSSEFPVSGWTHDNGLGAISAGSSFNEPVTGLAPGTKYYFVAWVHVGGVWYPGNVLTFIAPVLSASCPAGTIQSGSPLETVVVNSNSATPTLSTNTLTSGQSYLLVSSGTWQNAGSMMVDSAFASTDNWITYIEGQDTAPYFLGPQELQLQVDNGFVNWGPYDGTHHTYSYLYQGNNSPVALGVFDGDSNTATPNPSWYGDNVGNLNVSIYSCNVPAPVIYVTTDAASNVATSSVTVNGTNGPFAASDTSFWLGTTSSTPFVSSTDPASELPSGWYGIDSLSQSASSSFSHSYVGLTPSTTYYYAAWSQVGGVWYPGQILTFKTAALNGDATLSALDVSAGQLLPDFSPSVTSYTDVLPYNTSNVWVTATTTDPNATDTITQAGSTTGTATVHVTAQDGTTHQDYTVAFSLAPASTSQLTVKVLVDNTGGGTKTPADFTVKVIADSSSTLTFPGSATGTVVMIAPNSDYGVNIVGGHPHYTETKDNCHESGIPAGSSEICTITETYKAFGNDNDSVIVGGGSPFGGPSGEVLGASITGNEFLQQQIAQLQQQLLALLQQYLTQLHSHGTH